MIENARLANAVHVLAQQSIDRRRHTQEDAVKLLVYMIICDDCTHYCVFLFYRMLMV